MLTRKGVSRGAHILKKSSRSGPQTLVYHLFPCQNEGLMLPEAMCWMHWARWWTIPLTSQTFLNSVPKNQRTLRIIREKKDSMWVGVKSNRKLVRILFSSYLFFWEFSLTLKWGPDWSLKRYNEGSDVLHPPKKNFYQHMRQFFCYWPHFV